MKLSGEFLAGIKAGVTAFREGRTTSWEKVEGEDYHALGLCGDLSVAKGLRCTRERGHDRTHSAFVELAPCSGPSGSSRDYEIARRGGWDSWG